MQRKLLKDLPVTLYYFLLIFLPSQLNYYFWPSWSFVLGRKIDLLSPSVYFTDFLILSLLVAWGLQKSSVTFKLTAIQKIVVFIFVLLTVVNILISHSPILALFGWLEVCKYVLLTLCVIDLNQSITKSTIFLTIGAFWSSSLAFLQISKEHSIGGLWYFLGERSFSLSTLNVAKTTIPFHLPFISREIIIRAYSTFPHPNVFAGFLVFVLLLLLSQKNYITLLSFSTIQNIKKISCFNFFIKRRNNLIIDLLYWTIVIILLIALFFTFSKTAWLAFFLGVLWLLRISKSVKIFITILVISSVIITTWQTIVPFPYNESITVRKELNYAAVEMLKTSPWFGIGLKQFITNLPKHLLSRTIFFLQPVHNMYLLILTEIGVVPTFLFSILSYLLIKKSHPISQSSLFILIPFLLIGLNDHYLITLQQGQIVLSLVISYFFLLQKRKSIT